MRYNLNMFNKKLKFGKNLYELNDSELEILLLEWEKLLKLDFYSEPELKGGVWEATSRIWSDDVVQRLNSSQLVRIFKTIKERKPEEFLPQITALLSTLKFKYSDKKYLIELLINTKNIECYNALQSYIDSDFSIFNEGKEISFDSNMVDFCFSQQSTDSIGSRKAEKIITDYSSLNDEQAYLIVVSIFGLKYVTKTARKKLGVLVKTAPRYLDENLGAIPEYELSALDALL